ncbi:MULTISPECIES: hypothetical protein [Burkholderia]|uniref:hypothetical protein n=1 Tax=Burkholderia TaxID=32008 RepID=UPI0012E3A801|nr:MULTISPECIES: hypothetical protein [Burkholderia]
MRDASSLRCLAVLLSCCLAVLLSCCLAVQQLLYLFSGHFAAFPSQPLDPRVVPLFVWPRVAEAKRGAPANVCIISMKAATPCNLRCPTPATPEENKARHATRGRPSSAAAHRVDIGGFAQ